MSTAATGVPAFRELALAEVMLVSGGSLKDLDLEKIGKAAVSGAVGGAIGGTSGGIGGAVAGGIAGGVVGAIVEAVKELLE